MAYKLKSKYGYVDVEEVTISDLFLPPVSLTGAGSISVAALLVEDSIPNAANNLALYKRTGPFWQDVARSVPATTTGDPVKAWDDTSGNGLHLTWSSGNVPTLRAGGGITCVAGGAQLEATVSTVGSTTWSAYVTCTDSDTADTGWVWVANNAATPSTGFAPSYASFGALTVGIAGAYNTAAGTDTGALATRGISIAGTAITSFVGATEVSYSTSSSPFASIRLGTYGGTFLFVGDIVNAGFWSTADDATQRGITRTYLATA